MFNQRRLFGLALLLSVSCGGPDPVPPPQPAAERPTFPSQPAPTAPACPSSWLDAPHGGPCSTRGMVCSWDRTLGTRTAVCDGRGWRVVDLDRGCSQQPPTGACGQFGGSCGYIVEASYPGGKTPDYCLEKCFCDEGTWRCESTCSCPGKPTEDPLYDGEDSRFLELDGACLHQDMACTYQYRLGAGNVGAEDLVRQPCTTTFTCKGKWTHATECTCPMFSGDKGFSWSCRSSSALQCEFPPEDPGGPQRQCTCGAGERWNCK
jgi:hypothetical protein